MTASSSRSAGRIPRRVFWRRRATPWGGQAGRRPGARRGGRAGGAFRRDLGASRGPGIFGEVGRRGGESPPRTGAFEEAADMFMPPEQFDKVARVLAAEGRLWLAQGGTPRRWRIRTASHLGPGDVTAQLALGEALWLSGEPHAALAFSTARWHWPTAPPADALALPRRDPRRSGSGRDALRDLTRVRSRPRPETVAARALAFALTGRLRRRRTGGARRHRQRVGQRPGAAPRRPHQRPPRPPREVGEPCLPGTRRDRPRTPAPPAAAGGEPPAGVRVTPRLPASLSIRDT